VIDDTFLSEQRDLLVKLFEAQEIRKERETHLQSEKEKQIALAKEALERGMALSGSIIESKDILSQLISKLDKSSIAKIAVFAPSEGNRLLQKLIDIKTLITERKTLDESDVSELKAGMADASTLFADSTKAVSDKMRHYQTEMDTLNEQAAGLENRAKGYHLFLDNLPTFIIGSSLSVIIFKEVKISHFKIIDALSLKGWLDTIYYPDNGFFIVYLVGCVAALALATYKLIKRRHRRNRIIPRSNQKEA